MKLVMAVTELTRNRLVILKLGDYFGNLGDARYTEPRFVVAVVNIDHLRSRLMKH